MSIAAHALLPQALSANVAAQMAMLMAPMGPGVPPRVAVALSGGADSLALTLLADAWARGIGGQVVALTVDHRLRAESTHEAQQVAAWMHARGIAHAILTPSHMPAPNNLQAAARQWRYDALAEYCQAQGLLHCLVAHQAGDNRETIVQQQQRGVTADGGSGMRAIRLHRGVRFLRPLLQVERAQIEQFLRAQGAVWMEDPSNANTHFARVRVRQALAADPLQCAALDAQIMQESAARAARDDALAQAAMQVVMLSPLGYADMRRDGWMALAPTLASQLMADGLTMISGAANRPRAADTQRLVAAMLAKEIGKQTLHGCEVTWRNGTIRLAREVARVAPPLVLQGEGSVVWDNRFRVCYALPEGARWALGALGMMDQHCRVRGVPLATPVLQRLDSAVPTHYMGEALLHAPGFRVGFAPVKPLAAARFW